MYTTGMSKMRDDLLREISNFVMPIGDNNEDDEENVEYADNFSVNLSTSLSVLLLNPNQWWQEKKNNNDNNNTKNSESSRSSGSRSIQNVKERLYQQECERSKEKMKLWREYALILLGHGKNECLTTYETADTDSFFNCLTEILYKISNYVFHNDTNASLVSCESILNHFIHNEIIGNVLDTTISSKGIFNHRFMTAMDSKARIKFMICVRNLPEKKQNIKKNQKDVEDVEDVEEEEEEEIYESRLAVEVLIKRFSKSMNVSRTIMDHHSSVRSCSLLLLQKTFESLENVNTAASQIEISGLFQMILKTFLPVFDALHEYGMFNQATQEQFNCLLCHL